MISCRVIEAPATDRIEVEVEVGALLAGGLRAGLRGAQSYTLSLNGVDRCGISLGVEGRCTGLLEEAVDCLVGDLESSRRRSRRRCRMVDERRLRLAVPRVGPPVPRSSRAGRRGVASRRLQGMRNANIGPNKATRRVA